MCLRLFPAAGCECGSQITVLVQGKEGTCSARSRLADLFLAMLAAMMRTTQGHMVGPAETPPKTRRNFSKSHLLKVTLQRQSGL